MNKSKTWLEVTISADNEVFDVVENFLFDQGSFGTEETADSVKGYFPDSISKKEIEHSLESYLKSLKSLGFYTGEPIFREIPVEDWNNRWKENFKPVQVTSRIIVKPPWEKLQVPEDQIVIEIMPRMAFGTGTHETTRLCLELLEKHLKPTQSILDIGTGSGILAITAAKLGAANVLAIDTDEDALSNTRENVVQNHVEHLVDIRSGSLETVANKTFDLVLANINRTVLSELLPTVKDFIHSESRLILSGFLVTEKELSKRMLSNAGFRLLEMNKKGEWIGFVVLSDIGTSSGIQIVEEEKRISE